MTPAAAKRHYGVEVESGTKLRELQRLEQRFGDRVPKWAQEGMPTEVMGKSARMERFREREGTPVPWNVEEHNEQSVQRSADAAADTSPSGDAGVPESVRDVISSSGQSLDVSIQRAMEDRMGDSFGDVRVHAGSTAARACEQIDARAFTVGNHVAFNSGEYDPSSPEGQHVLAHELAHVRQQTGGTVSMLPKEDVELEIDPDPALEREAEETAQRVMQGGELGIQRLGDSEVHVQRVDKTRREVIRGDVSAEEVAVGVEAAELNPVDVDIDVDPDTLRDAYKLAEYLSVAGPSWGSGQIAQAIASEFGIDFPVAVGVSLAVGGAITLKKARLHRDDYYIVYEVGKALGAEDRVVAFFDEMNMDIQPESELEGEARSREDE